MILDSGLLFGSPCIYSNKRKKTICGHIRKNQFSSIQLWDL